MSIGAPELATKKYWDLRYAEQDKDGYDWFKKYSDLKTDIERHLQPESKILVLGCGTSSLSQDLYLAGYKHVHSIDFSPAAIDIQRSKNELRTEMTFEVMDIRSLKLPDRSFDVAIDKGTMDALLCYNGSPWDPPPDVVENCRREIEEAARVLAPNGVFLMISFRPSHFLKPRVQSSSWKDEPLIKQIGDFYSFVVARKDA